MNPHIFTFENLKPANVWFFGSVQVQHIHQYICCRSSNISIDQSFPLRTLLSQYSLIRGESKGDSECDKRCWAWLLQGEETCLWGEQKVRGHWLDVCVHDILQVCWVGNAANDQSPMSGD